MKRRRSRKQDLYAIAGGALIAAGIPSIPRACFVMIGIYLIVWAHGQ